MSSAGISYLAGISNILALPIATLAAYFAFRSMPRAAHSDEAPMSGKVTNPVLPMRFWVLAIIGAILYAFSAYAAVFHPPRVGPPGAPGPQGEAGSPGTAGPKGDKGRDGSVANSLDLETKLSSLVTVVTNLQHKVDDASRDANLLRRYAKVKDCIQDISVFEPLLKSSYDREVQAIVPTSPASQDMQSFMMMRQHGYMQQPNLLNTINQDFTKIKTCIPNFDPKLKDLDEDQLETAVPNEPKGDFDQQRKYRKAYAKNNQAALIINSAKQQLVLEEQLLKSQIDN